jgi:hypothetical protein
MSEGLSVGKRWTVISARVDPGIDFSEKAAASIDEFLPYSGNPRV